jgi:hypothetical protein
MEKKEKGSTVHLNFKVREDLHFLLTIISKKKMVTITKLMEDVIISYIERHCDIVEMVKERLSCIRSFDVNEKSIKKELTTNSTKNTHNDVSGVGSVANAAAEYMKQKGPA